MQSAAIEDGYEEFSDLLELRVYLSAIVQLGKEGALRPLYEENILITCK